MQLSHTGSEEKLGKIKKSWGKLREVMGQFLHLIQEDAIGFNSLRSRFHISRLFFFMWFSNDKFSIGVQSRYLYCSILLCDSS